MTFNESVLKSKMMIAIKLGLPGFIAFRHEDVRSVGIPDLSLTGNGRTSWWEAKYDDDDGFKSTGIQELTMCRLARHGHARYIVWENKKNIRRTLIVHPTNIGTCVPEVFCRGFDMSWLIDYMQNTHG